MPTNITVEHAELITLDEPVDVFDIQVDVDESFVCGGIVLSNSSICRTRDSLQYTPVEHKPIGHSVPWLQGPGRSHWNCRSSSVPITKSWRELGIDEDELPITTRASMDGQVPADMTYSDWLKKQPRSVVDEILGEKKAKLFLDGGVTLDRFEDRAGNELSLKELRAREAEAFRKVGLS
jgi:hypothetical protein